MNKTKLALISAVALFSIGVSVGVSADETVSEVVAQEQIVSVEQNEFDTSNILSVFFDGKDTHVSLKNGENWVLEDYEGKFGDFEFTSQITPSRLRGVPSSKYLTTSWYGYGTPPSRISVQSGVYTYNDSRYGGKVQAIFGGSIPRTGGSQGTGGGVAAYYGGNCPVIALSPA